MKELGTFGAIISFALELENQAFGFYESLNDTDFFQTLSFLLKGSTKRIGRLKRIRQELVTEMILEPMTGVNGDEYRVTLADESGGTEVIQQAVHLEENMGSFYAMAAPLIPMKEVERAFLRLAKENGNRKVKLEEMMSMP
jgi:rubrerythrin